MDRCEEDVIVACGLYLLAEEEMIKKKKILDSSSVSSKKRGRKFSHSGRLKDDRRGMCTA
jgi:hypothetical protein